jgi:integrase
LADGKHPVILRVTHKRARRYYTLPNLKADVNTWNDDLGRYNDGKKFSKSNKEINLWESKADAALQVIRTQHQQFSFDRFERTFFGSLKNITVYSFIANEIEQMKKDGRFSSMNVAKPMLSRLKEFHPKEFSFIDFDYTFLTGFQNHLANTCTTNGIAAYFRTLKAFINKAIKLGYAEDGSNPFRNLTIKKEATLKRALSKEQMAAIINHKISDCTRLFHSKNYFVFSYLCRGINFMDMALLTWDENILGDRIVYLRSKTKKTGSNFLSIPIRGLTADIIRYYRSHSFGNKYVFPILKPGYNTLQQKQRVNDLLKKTNDDLKTICSSENLNIQTSHEITFYVARHTWATVQKRSGTSTELIQEGLGHQNKVITETYLAQFESSILDDTDKIIFATVGDIAQ